MVLGKYDNYFIVKKVIFERAQFNLHKQQPGKTASSFITAIHKLVQTCGYDVLREDFIQNPLVVGISYATLFEKLQMIADFTLEKAITLPRQSELVHNQQDMFRSNSAQLISSKSK